VKRRNVIIAIWLALMGSIPAMAAERASPLNRTVPESRVPHRPEAPAMKIRLIADGRTLTATLVDSPTTRDFLAMLPITLTLKDYASTEKIAYLPRKLAEQGAPAGVDPAVGDLTYYAPWGNLALFYRDFGYAKGLIKLGTFDGGVEVFDVPGSVTVTIEHMGE
jgi:hypothetical protein